MFRYRNIDGLCNNLQNGYWGAANTMFSRKLPPLYRDGMGIPFGSTAFQYRVHEVDESARRKRSAKSDLASAMSRMVMDPDNYTVCDGPLPNQLPEPREVSRVFHSDDNVPDRVNSLMVMQFGQFLDHDITLTPESELEEEGDCCDIDPSNAEIGECFPIPLRPDDEFVENEGLNCLDFKRSSAFCPDVLEHREQFNIITHFIDLSNIYGSDDEFSCMLRSDSNGTLLSQTLEEQEYLPCLDDSGILISGDIRAVEMPGLTSMHTLFLREHNGISDIINQHTSGLTSEEIFQETRRIMIGQFQNIVYKEFLPAVLGRSIPPLRIRAGVSRYQSEVDPSITNEFATAAYRFGHTLIQGVIFGRYCLQ